MLVENKELRQRFMDLIVPEFELTRQFLGGVLQSDMSQRRPRMVKTLGIREESLRVLHQPPSHRACGRRSDNTQAASGRGLDSNCAVKELSLNAEQFFPGGLGDG